MGSHHIRATDSGFLTARGAHRSAIDEIKSLSRAQQNLLDGLRFSWQGDGAEAYKAAAAEISRQTIKGSFMLRSIESQAGGAYKVLCDVDHGLVPHLQSTNQGR